MNKDETVSEEVMRNSDKELIESLKTVLRGFLEDQKQSKPFFRVQEIRGEIHGALADIMFIDKVDNQLLVGFIIGLLYQAKTEEEIMKTVRAVYATLDTYDT